MREIVKTEDPNGSVITIDTLDEPCDRDQDRRSIRLWAGDFTHLGTWCFECKRFHTSPHA